MYKRQAQQLRCPDQHRYKSDALIDEATYRGRHLQNQLLIDIPLKERSCIITSLRQEYQMSDWSQMQEKTRRKVGKNFIIFVGSSSSHLMRQNPLAEKTNHTSYLIGPPFSENSVRWCAIIICWRSELGRGRTEEWVSAHLDEFC